MENYKHTSQKFVQFFFLMFLEEVSSAHLGCIYLIRNTVKYNKKSNIVKYYNITDSQV